MTRRSRAAHILMPMTLTLGLSGCYGTSEDKGDNSSKTIYTPKPSTVEDANTAGERKTALPPAEKAGPKGVITTEGEPK